MLHRIIFAFSSYAWTNKTMHTNTSAAVTDWDIVEGGREWDVKSHSENLIKLLIAGRTIEVHFQEMMYNELFSYRSYITWRYRQYNIVNVNGIELLTDEQQITNI